MSKEQFIKPVQVLRSKLDVSVNHVFDSGQEARYIRRSDDELIIYLSSHNGCNKACRFCHLTQTRQTDFVESTIDEIVGQATSILLEYANKVCDGESTAKVLHYNFMARGEALASSVIADNWDELSKRLANAAYDFGIGEGKIKFKISTIMPVGMKPLIEMFPLGTRYQPEIYYSLYSVDPDFRKHWMPNAMGFVAAIDDIAKWQKSTSGRLVVHCAFIAGENDKYTTEVNKHLILTGNGLKYDYNIVRYNPYSEAQGKETSDFNLRYMLNTALSWVDGTGKAQIVDRVGYDVAASCGMFTVK